MKTTTGQDILNQAAELAQRTRDKIPVSEQVLLQGYVATEFQMLLDSQSWPELIPAVFNVTNAANRQFSKNEGSVDPLNPEMGDILWVGLGNPEASPGTFCRGAHPVAFSEGNGVVFVESNHTSLWVEYVLPYPGVVFPDLALLTTAQFLVQVLPRRFRNILAHKAAAHLLGSDNNPAAAGVQFGLAQAALVFEINRLPPLPWWRATARLMRPRERHHFGTPLCV